MVLGYAPMSVRRVRGRLCARQRQWAQAREHFDRAIEELGTGHASWELAQTYLDYADMCLVRRRRGDSRKASAARLQAKGILRRSGHPSEDGVAIASGNGDPFGLTGRELEVLTLVGHGRRNQDIAGALSLSTGTVNRHLENIYLKMQVTNRTEAVIKAVQAGLIGSLSDIAASAPRG